MRDPLESDCVEQARGWLRDVKTQVEELALVDELLSQLSQATKSLHADLKNRMSQVASKHGFSMLPNETVIQILKYSSHTPLAERRKLSTVCRRFRDIINSTPEFWTNISSRLHLDLVDLYITRSSRAPLTIELDVGHFLSDTCAEFLEKVVPHCYRWRSFSYKVTDLPLVHGLQETLEDIGISLSDLDLPVLRSAYIEYPMLGTGDSGLTTEDEAFHYYESWNAPSLEYLDCANILPRFNESFKLKSFKMIVYTCDPGEHLEWTPPELGRYLSQNPLLESIELGLTYMDEFSDDDVYDWEPFELPSLRSLNFSDLPTAQSPLTTITQLLYILKTPALESLSLCICDEEFTTANIARLFSKHSSYTNVKRFSLSVFDSKRDEAPDFQPLQVVLPKMPSLQHIVLESPDFKIGVQTRQPMQTAQTYSSLRTVHLKNCIGVKVSDLRRFMEFLRKDDGWDEFERLRVSGCSDIKPLVNSKQVLKKVLPEEKFLLEA